MSRIVDMYKEAEEERNAILEQIAPLAAKEEEIRAKIGPLEEELRKVREEIVALEIPRLQEVTQIMSSLAPKAIRLMAEGGKIGTK
jgi:uncharacterized coiled-coil DUF342 family protein